MGPSKPRFRAAARQRRRALPRVRPRRGVPVRAGAQIHALRREQGAAVRAARPPRLLPATSSCRRPATAPTTAPWSTRCLASGGRARGVATVRRDVTDDELKRLHDAGRARRPLQFRQAPRRLHAEGRTDGDRRPHREARLARRHLFRGGRPARTLGLLHRPADDGRRRPHGPARCDEAGRRPRIRAVPQIHARERQCLEQGRPARSACRSPGRRR